MDIKEIKSSFIKMFKESVRPLSQLPQWTIRAHTELECYEKKYGKEFINKAKELARTTPYSILDCCSSLARELCRLEEHILYGDSEIESKGFINHD